MYLVRVGEQQADPAALGTQIGDARRAKGLTQQQLADALGVDRKTVNRWETGRTHGLGLNVAKLGEVLGWSDAHVAQVLRGQVDAGLVRPTANAIPHVEIDLPVGGPLPPEVDHFLRMLQSFDPGLRAQALKMLEQINWTLTVATTGSAIPVEEVLRMAEDEPATRMRGSMQDHAHSDG